jgi:hypothetical protein
MTHHRSLIRVFVSILTLLFALAATVPAFAADLVVTRYFSGLWDQPKQENQGIVLQIIDHDVEVKRAVAYWFTYGDDLETAWYIGIGQVEGQQVVLDMYTVSGIAFMEDDLPDVDNVEPVGAMTLSFQNCNHGVASYELATAEPNSGEFDIKKLAGLYNSRCSGGISDDTPSNARPIKLEVALEPAREGITGNGKARFWERTDRSDFHVTAEDIPDGVYDLRVCEGEIENPVGTLTVHLGEGSVQFRSPESAGKPLLTFDPRECLIELHDAGGAVLTSGDDYLAEKPGGTDGGPHGIMEVSVDLDNVGGPPEASGEAAYRSKNNSVEFEVEVERLPAGDYVLLVDGVMRAGFAVTEYDDKTKGRVRFSDPQKDDWLLLDFNPAGLLIEVLEDGGVDPLLEAYFPGE